jgi:hypothetical protein
VLEAHVYVCHVNLVAMSFSWPFQGRWKARWAIGVLTLLVLPLGFIPLLGYAVAATRGASADPSNGPPPWKLSIRLLSDGLWAALLLLLLTAPFGLALNPLADGLDQAHLWHVSDRVLSHIYALVGAAFIVALPWGLVLLVLVPHGVLRYASSGSPLDLFDFPAAIRDVRRDFATWNVAAAAMVTAWAIGLACSGLLCVGILPGIFYAILVSAHACAALETTPRAWPSASGANPPAG